MDLISLTLAKNYTDTVTKTLAGGLKYQGSVATVSNLPTASTSIKGHMYTVTANGHEYVCDGTQWVDLSADLANKQDKLTVNPSTTTDTLTGLTIDGTAYAISGGSVTIPVTDVKVNGASVVTNKVANITGYTVTLEE